MPLIGESQPIGNLNSEYLNDAQVKYLAAKYRAIRRTCPVPTSFSLAFTFAYLEYIVGNKEEFSKFYQYATIAREKLRKAQCPKFTTEKDHGTFMEYIDRCNPKDDTSKALAELDKLFVIKGRAEGIVDHLRLIVDCQPKNSDFECEEFSWEKVAHEMKNPSTEDPEQIFLKTIYLAFGIGIRIEYMDRGEENQVLPENFPDDCEPDIFLLYRDGHYDILYPKEDQQKKG